MTQPRREFLATFTPEVLSDLRAAARHLMAQICSHDPEDCGCELNRFTPAEFVDWLEMEVEREHGKPVRFELGHRPRRMKDEPGPLNLAIAG